jgi:hypothetical protein
MEQSTKPRRRATREKEESLMGMVENNIKSEMARRRLDCLPVVRAFVVDGAAIEPAEITPPVQKMIDVATETLRRGWEPDHAADTAWRLGKFAARDVKLRPFPVLDEIGVVSMGWAMLLKS